MREHQPESHLPPFQLPPSRITGLILAGGQGSRMGHVDKGLQTLHGQPLYQHVITRLRQQTGTMLINANRNQAQYQSSGCLVLADQIDGFAGPLAGMAVGLQHASTDYVLCVPCDSPFLPLDLAEQLGAALLAQSADLAMAMTREDGKIQSQPVFCLLKRTLLPDLLDFLQRGGRKINGWFEQFTVARVIFDDASAFRNLNTLPELEQAEAEIALKL
jgi:molybdenum cofactor guanylyltransferase